MAMLLLSPSGARSVDEAGSRRPGLFSDGKQSGETGYFGTENKLAILQQ